MVRGGAGLGAMGRSSGLRGKLGLARRWGRWSWLGLGPDSGKDGQNGWEDSFVDSWIPQVPLRFCWSTPNSPKSEKEWRQRRVETFQSGDGAETFKSGDGVETFKSGDGVETGLKRG